MGKETEEMIRELDRVVLNDDFPEEGLRAGDIGTVVSRRESI